MPQTHTQNRDRERDKKEIVPHERQKDSHRMPFKFHISFYTSFAYFGIISLTAWKLFSCKFNLKDAKQFQFWLNLLECFSSTLGPTKSQTPKHASLHTDRYGNIHFFLLIMAKTYFESHFYSCFILIYTCAWIDVTKFFAGIKEKKNGISRLKSQ